MLEQQLTQLQLEEKVLLRDCGEDHPQVQTVRAKITATREKRESQMRYRMVFIVGFGIGFVLGARAGRERYEQMRKLARKAADSPAVQQAAGAVQAQAADLAKLAKGKFAERAGMARAKMGGK